MYTIEDKNNFAPLAAKDNPSSRMLDIVITETMVLKQLASLNINKSPGPDMIHPRILHEIRHSIAPFFSTSV